MPVEPSQTLPELINLMSPNPIQSFFVYFSHNLPIVKHNKNDKKPLIMDSCIDMKKLKYKLIIKPKNKKGNNKTSGIILRFISI